MRNRMLRASPLSVGVLVVIAAVSIVGFTFTKHSADQQEQTLLASNTNQAAVYIGSVFSGVGSILDPLATAVTLTGGSPAAFDDRAKALTQGQLVLVLAQRQGSGYVVTAESGAGFQVGQTLGPALSSALSKAGAKATPTGVVFNGKTSTAGFAVGPPLTPTGDAVYLQFSLNPFVASPVTASKPFASLKVAVYGAPTADRNSLLVANTSQVPVPRPNYVTTTKVGDATWTLVADARQPLTGGFAHQAPYVILLLGLVLALLLSGTVEVLVRRHRYAAELVSERTADLKQSLADLREAQDALVRSERLTALGEMASVVGHELRNPLAAVTNALYLLRRILGEPAPENLEKHLTMAERETAKAAALAEDLTAFVRPREPQKEEVELRDLVNEVVETTPPPRGISLSVEIEDALLEVDRRQMAEVLANLVTNAYQAIGETGNVRIKGRIEPGGAAVVVDDTGPGVSEDMAERIFEPFFTTKHDGTGLGLAIVRRLVEAHGGTVRFEDRDGEQGARVVVHLPGSRRTGPDSDGHSSGARPERATVGGTRA
ncbi:MAG TPA: HAMP domain-containing sensor histidine kinase [Acidimicrobiales bacterium]|nr:HAMP domain-containing sensor histidine kinase [Acidimicrobiales bacterium]